ncbi:hypothetical protein BHM03_00030433 [Ensete ventricosum]|nr:hypothetical protein BHM03_00030433 [Ensete ventricosum]
MDRQRSISTVGDRLREKKERRRGKEKRRRGEEEYLTPSSPARRRRPRVAHEPSSPARRRRPRVARGRFFSHSGRKIKVTSSTISVPTKHRYTSTDQ